MAQWVYFVDFEIPLNLSESIYDPYLPRKFLTKKRVPYVSSPLCTQKILQYLLREHALYLLKRILCTQKIKSVSLMFPKILQNLFMELRPLCTQFTALRR